MMTLTFLFFLTSSSLLADVAVLAQTLMPYCPDRATPRDVDSPCTDGCLFLCNEYVCQVTQTVATTISCGVRVRRPLCGGDTPNPSSDLLCASGCIYLCSNTDGSQKSRCTLTMDPPAEPWRLTFQPLSTTRENATDCSSSSKCIAQVGECTRLTRRCKCFSDGSFQEAGCFRVWPVAPTTLPPGSSGTMAPSPSQNTSTTTGTTSLSTTVITTLMTEFVPPISTTLSAAITTTADNSAMVGGIVGAGILAVLLVAGLILFLVKLRERQANRQTTESVAASEPSSESNYGHLPLQPLSKGNSYGEIMVMPDQYDRGDLSLR